MAEIVNLNRYRKGKAKLEQQRQADANRIAFGRTKAEKQASRREAERQEQDLDGKKVED